MLQDQSFWKNNLWWMSCVFLILGFIDLYNGFFSKTIPILGSLIHNFAISGALVMGAVSYLRYNDKRALIPGIIALLWLAFVLLMSLYFALASR